MLPINIDTIDIIFGRIDDLKKNSSRLEWKVLSKIIRDHTEEETVKVHEERGKRGPTLYGYTRVLDQGCKYGIISCVVRVACVWIYTYLDSNIGR